jgi:hypothetical protein
VTLRALVIAVALTALTGVWVRQAEIVVLATQVTESVPPIPALAALVLLLPVNALLRRRPGLLPGVTPLSPAELMLVYLFVSVASMVMGIGVVQFLICLIATPFYKQPQEYAVLRPHFAAWLLPRGGNPVAAIRPLYERAPDGRTPWEMWAVPGALWCLFFVTLAGCLFCLMALFRRAWAEDERLPFPLVSLPLDMADPSDSFWRNGLMWLGFGVAAAYNGVNILHAFVPSAPAIGKEIALGAWLTIPPWSAAQPLSMHLRPELLGLGYLVSAEVSLTVWLGHLLIKGLAVLAAARGYEPNGLYNLEQGMGAYLALAVVLVWQARRRLAQADGRLVAGAALGFAAVCAFAAAAGMAVWAAVAYLALVVAVAVVYGRIRAQTGVPMVWLFPYHMQSQALYYTLGSAPFAAAGPTTVVAWTTFVVLARGYFPTISGFQTEGIEIGRRARITPGHIAAVILLAVAAGFALGWYHHLTAYHAGGALQLRGDIWGSWAADSEMDFAVKALKGPVPPDMTRVAATGAGAATVAALSFLSARFVSFPLNPVGYAMAACFGEVLWFPFLLVWLLKTLALRYGGMRFYRRTVPFFLGLALGHFATAGIFWGLVGAVSGEAVRGYEVWFG